MWMKETPDIEPKIKNHREQYIHGFSCNVVNCKPISNSTVWQMEWHLASSSSAYLHSGWNSTSFFILLSSSLLTLIAYTSLLISYLLNILHLLSYLHLCNRGLFIQELLASYYYLQIPWTAPIRIYTPKTPLQPAAIIHLKQKTPPGCDSDNWPWM